MKFVYNMLLLVVLAFGFQACDKKDEDKTIDQSQLPQAAKDFIATHFKGNSISWVEKDNDSYDVHFSNGDAIDFDLNGRWEEVDCRTNSVPEAIVPEAIRNVLAAQYPNIKIVQIERHAERSGGYGVELFNRIELDFDRSFNLIEIDRD